MADKKKASATASQAKSSPVSSVKAVLAKVAIHGQTKLFTFGIALPAALAWLGAYLMFTFPPLLGQVETFLKNFTPAQAPAIYTNLLTPLNANSGLAYYVIGIVLFILAILVARFVAIKSSLANLKLGDIRVRSLLMTALVTFIVIAIVVSLANKVLFDPLLALQAA